MFFARQYHKQQESSMPKQPAVAPQKNANKTMPVCYSGIQFDRLCNILSLNRCHQPGGTFLKH